MTTLATIKMKEWDTVALRCQYLQDDDTPLSLEGVTIKSSIKNYYNSPPYILRVEIVDKDSGTFTLHCEESRLLPTKYKVDILFQNTQTQTRISSDTFELLVLPAITSPEE